MTEQAQLFGPRRSLVGIVAEPAPSAAGDHPTVVILNSGIVHRVGANRMSVPLARALAAAGYPAIRFDLSGLGDSAPRPDALAPLDASLADIREVVDSLEQTRGTRRVILAGLCAGADHSLVYARTDDRIVGAVLLDPSLPRTRRHKYLHYRRKLGTPESWWNLLRGRNPLLRQLLRNASGGGGPRQPSLQDPEVRAYLAAAYAGALANDVQLLAVLTGERSYYREQLLEAFPQVEFGGRLRLEYFPRADHMFSASADRGRVIELIVEWARAKAFAPDRASPGSRATGTGGALT